MEGTSALAAYKVVWSQMTRTINERIFVIQMFVIKSFDLETNKNMEYKRNIYSELKIAFDDLQSKIMEF